MAIFLKIVLSLLYSLIRALVWPIRQSSSKKRVVMISRISREETLDFRLLREYIENETDAKVVVLPHRITNKLLVIPDMIAEMYHLSLAHSVIIDSYIPTISLLRHRKNLVVIQIWHSLACIKRFGWAALDTTEGTSTKTARALNMHQGYTYVSVGSEAMAPFFAEAYNISPDIIRPYGLPRVDYLLDERAKAIAQQKIYKQYPSLKTKPTILWAPTFRERPLPAEEVVKKFDFERFNLVIKPHPNTTITDNADQAIVDRSFSLLDLLFIADVVITDYSAAAMEAAVLGIPMAFFTFDLDDYRKDRGLFIDYEAEMPGRIVKTADELIDEINKNSYDTLKIQRFKDKYVTALDGSATEKIVELLDI